MAKGKTTCRILKEIRRQIAEANDIEYVVEECQYKGDCKGTCPKCEAEVRYLENQLHKRQMLGKAVVVAGLSLGVIPAMAQEVSVVESKPITTTTLNNEATGKYIIKGKIVDDSGETIHGCSVRVADDSKNINTISNTQGEFALGVDSLPVSVSVLYVGYKNLDFQVTEENYNQFFVLTLNEDYTGEIERTKKEKREAKKAAKRRKRVKSDK